MSRCIKIRVLHRSGYMVFEIIIFFSCLGFSLFIKIGNLEKYACRLKFLQLMDVLICSDDESSYSTVNGPFHFHFNSYKALEVKR